MCVRALFFIDRVYDAIDRRHRRRRRPLHLFRSCALLREGGLCERIRTFAATADPAHACGLRLLAIGCHERHIRVLQGRAYSLVRFIAGSSDTVYLFFSRCAYCAHACSYNNRAMRRFVSSAPTTSRILPTRRRGRSAGRRVNTSSIALREAQNQTSALQEIGDILSRPTRLGSNDIKRIKQLRDRIPSVSKSVVDGLVANIIQRRLANDVKNMQERLQRKKTAAKSSGISVTSRTRSGSQRSTRAETPKKSVSANSPEQKLISAKMFLKDILNSPFATPKKKKEAMHIFGELRTLLKEEMRRENTTHLYV